MTPWLRQIGRALVIAREIKGVSRRDLAVAAGITRTQLSRYERGALMRLETIDKLLRSLEVSPHAFFLLIAALDPPPADSFRYPGRDRLPILLLLCDAFGVRRRLAEPNES